MTRLWTISEKLSALMRLPWTVRLDHEEDGSLVAQVFEIPDAIGTGATMREVSVDLWDSLLASLKIRLENDDPIALPAGAGLPWVDNPVPPSLRRPQPARLARQAQELSHELRSEATQSTGALVA